MAKNVSVCLTFDFDAMSVWIGTFHSVCARLLDDAGELPPCVFGADDQPRREIRRNRLAIAVRRHQSPEPGHHGGVVRDDNRIARLPKTLFREIQRGDDGRSLVGQEIFRVILHHGIAVGVHRGPRPLEPVPELLAASRSAFAA